MPDANGNFKGAAYPHVPWETEADRRRQAREERKMKYRVTTASGTHHIVDDEAQTITRYPAEGHEWGDRGGAYILHPDYEPLHYTSITPLPEHFADNIGESIFVSNSEVWRQTSPIREVEVLESELDAEDIAYLKAEASDEWQARGGGGL